MKTSFLILALVSSLAFADDTPIEPASGPVDPKASPVADITYECTASSGHEQHAMNVTLYKELSQREPPIRMKVGGTMMAFTAFEMNGKENMKMLNLAIQASDKKGRPITAQRSEYYGAPPIKGFYVRLAFGKASISCEMK
jgi:hypothetical protein